MQLMEDNMPSAVMLVQVLFMYSCRIILGRLVFAYAMYALMNTWLMTTRADGS